MTSPTLRSHADREIQGIGFVKSVKGCKVTLGLPQDMTRRDDRATVGRFVGIRAGLVYLVGVITELETDFDHSSGPRGLAGLDLLGEIVTDASGLRSFRRGVAEYPAIGDAAELISRSDLRLIYESASQRTQAIGTLQQDATVPALIDVDDLVSRHFAVLGSTGVGKSSGVAVLLASILAARSDLRVFLLDVHSEYGRCFGDRAHLVGARNLKLPFWIFNFEETVDVIYGGRPAIAEEIEILMELIPIVKSTYEQYKSTSDRLLTRRADPKSTGYTVDTPVPYVFQDLITLIDERMGRLENRSSRMHYHRLMMRLETLRNDPRYAFMFDNALVGGDVMGDLVSRLFRLRPDGKPITVMQLGGLPAEATDAVVCVLCRLAFEFGLWSEGAVPLLFVCEEAHRYASADTSVGFHPTRRALSRIAKEGRKNGVYLGLVTQRPAELDPTIISQCGTLFAMRMANEDDQALLRSAVSDGAANLLAFVPSLGVREAIGFGEGVPLPARMVFAELPPERLPHGEVGLASAELAAAADDADFMRIVLDRWRGATMSQKASRGDDERDGRSSIVAPAKAMTALDLARSRLLKRPPEAGEGVAASAAVPDARVARP